MEPEWSVRLATPPVYWGAFFVNQLKVSTEMNRGKSFLPSEQQRLDDC